MKYGIHSEFKRRIAKALVSPFIDKINKRKALRPIKQSTNENENLNEDIPLSAHMLLEQKVKKALRAGYAK